VGEGARPGLTRRPCAVSLARMLTFLADHLDLVMIAGAVLFFMFQAELTGRNAH
jgi:hypothetical protein